MSENDENDVQILIDEVEPDVRDTLGTDSPQYVLWQKQKKYNSFKKKCQMCWHPLIIQFALSLFYSSRVAYRTATSSRFLALPSELTLRDYTHWCSAESGIQFEYLEQAKQIMLREGMN